MQLCLSMNYAYEFSYLLLAVPWQAVIGLSCFSGYYYSPVLRFYVMFINYCSIYELFMPDLLYLGLQALVVLGSEAPSSQVAPVPWCHARPEVMAGWDKMAALQATIRLSGWWNAPHCLSCYVSVSNGSKKHNGVTAPPFGGCLILWATGVVVVALQLPSQVRPCRPSPWAFPPPLLSLSPLSKLGPHKLSTTLQTWDVWLHCFCGKY